MRTDGIQPLAGLSNLRKLIALLVTIPACAIGAVVVAQQKKAATPDREWRTYNHDLAGTRFSPLTEINTANVANLKVPTGLVLKRFWTQAGANQPACAFASRLPSSPTPR